MQSSVKSANHHVSHHDSHHDSHHHSYHVNSNSDRNSLTYHEANAALYCFKVHKNYISEDDISEHFNSGHFTSEHFSSGHFSSGPFSSGHFSSGHSLMHGEVDTGEISQNTHGIDSNSELNGFATRFLARKLALVYEQLKSINGFEFSNFDAFKQQVLSAVTPQVELKKWQSIASRR